MQSAYVEQLAPAFAFPTSFSGLEGHPPFTCSALDEMFELLDPLELLALLGSVGSDPDVGIDEPLPPLQARRKRAAAALPVEVDENRPETHARERIDISRSKKKVAAPSARRVPLVRACVLARLRPRRAPSRRVLRQADATRGATRPARSPDIRRWETDANDVDFHVHDARGGHAFYSQKELASGGTLYADVTTGYGPECFTIRAPRDRRAYPYRLQASYFSRGPMGYGMGKLELIDHDGKGNLVFDERPFVVMADNAFVDLGTVDTRALAQPSAMK